MTTILLWVGNVRVICKFRSTTVKVKRKQLYKKYGSK